DKGTWWPPFPPRTQSDSRAMPSRRGFGVPPGDVGHDHAYGVQRKHLLPRALALQLFHQLRQGEGIDHVCFGEPAFARDAGAKAEKAGLFVAVRVAIDDAFNTLRLCIGPEPPIEIEPVRVGVEL